MVRPVEDERRVGHFEEEFVAGEVCPLGLQQVVGIGVFRRVGRFRRNQRTAAQADVRVLEVPGGIDPVLLRQLIGEADSVGDIVLLVNGGPAQVGRVNRCVLRRVGPVPRKQILIAEHAMRREEPQPVLLDGPTHRRIGVVGAIRRIDEQEPTVFQLLGQIVADHVVVRVVAADQSREAVAAVFRDHVRLEAAVLELGGLAAQLDAHFLRGARVEVEATSLPLAVELHAVEEGTVVAGMPAVNHGVGVHGVNVAADILRGGRNHHAHRHLRKAAHFLRERQRVEHLARHDCRLGRALHIDDRGHTRDGQRFLERADAHFRIDLRGERCRQLDLLAPDRAETGEGERHGIRSRPEVDDLVLTLLVGHDGPDFLDQSVAGGLDRDAGDHGTRRISDHAGDTGRQRLRGGVCRQDQQRTERKHADLPDSIHKLPPHVPNDCGRYISLSIRAK